MSGSWGGDSSFDNSDDVFLREQEILLGHLGNIISENILPILNQEKSLNEATFVLKDGQEEFLREYLEARLITGKFLSLYANSKELLDPMSIKMYDSTLDSLSIYLGNILRIRHQIQIEKPLLIAYSKGLISRVLE